MTHIIFNTAGLFHATAPSHASPRKINNTITIILVTHIPITDTRTPPPNATCKYTPGNRKRRKSLPSLIIIGTILSTISVTNATHTHTIHILFLILLLRNSDLIFIFTYMYKFVIITSITH